MVLHDVKGFLETDKMEKKIIYFLFLSKFNLKEILCLHVIKVTVPS